MIALLIGAVAFVCTDPLGVSLIVVAAIVFAVTNHAPAILTLLWMVLIMVYLGSLGRGVHTRVGVSRLEDKV